MMSRVQWIGVSLWLLVAFGVASCGAAEGDSTAVIPWSEAIGDYTCECGTVGSDGEVTVTGEGSARLFAQTTSKAVIDVDCEGQISFEMELAEIKSDTIFFSQVEDGAVEAYYISSQQLLRVTYEGSRYAIATK